MRQLVWRRASPWLLAGLLGVTGTAHFLITDSYQRIIPAALPYPREMVYVSGVAELLCAGGLAFRRTRRIAGWATAALFVVVFPANVQMAVDSAGGSPVRQLVTWGRLPLQVPLVAWAAQLARHASVKQPPSPATRACHQVKAMPSRASRSGL